MSTKRVVGGPVSVLSCMGTIAIVLAATSVYAQSSIPREETWVTDGALDAIVRSGDTVYIGGRFSYVGPHTGCGVPLDGSSGQPAGPFPKVNERVEACVSDGSGGWYIGGYFTQVGGVARNRIAHILADGSVDPAWNPNASGCVLDLAVSGTRVYAGGNFTSIGGESRNNIAALDAATGAATAWNPAANSTVYALAVSGTTVYAGGSFASIGGQARNCIAALDATTGAATAWNPNADDWVKALAVSGTTVYAGGDFRNISGQARNYVAALDAATGAATAWNPNASGSIYTTFILALAVSGTTVYAGGSFTSIGGQARNNIAALDAATGAATPWNPNARGNVFALAVSGTTVYAGGSFMRIGVQTRKRIAALDAGTGAATAWNPGASDHVSALAVSGTTVYAGGGFSSVGGQSRNYIAALDAATGSPRAWNPNADDYVRALAVSGTTVYAGGDFRNISGQTRNRIAALDAATGAATAWNPNASNRVYALAVSGTTVYAGGSFMSIGGKTRNGIAGLDATTGNATAWKPGGLGSSVYALAVSGSTLYAGGWFTNMGGQTRNNIAALDAATGAATAWNPNAEDYVRALAVSGTTVYAGGSFTSIGGEARNGIAALDAATGAATAWNPNADDYVYVRALAVSGTTVYAGGSFTSIGGQSRNCIAALDAATGAVTAWDPDLGYSCVYALAVSSTTVYAGGAFTSVGGDSRSYFAEFGQAPQVSSATATDSTTVQVVFDEAMTDDAALVDAANYTFSGGGVALTASGVVRIDATTVDVTVNEMTDGAAYTVHVDTTASGPTDLASNHVDPAHNSAGFTGIGVAPTATLACVAPEPTNAAVTVEVTLSESSTTFGAEDVSVVNATVDGFSGSGDSYSFTLTPTAQGQFACIVPPGTFTDAAGNANTELSNAVTRTYDITTPTATLTCGAPSVVNGPVSVEVTLSEASTTFGAGDISTSNATVDGFSGSGDSYSFALTPVAQGAFSCFVDVGTFTDLAGNPNVIASNTITRTYDNTPPDATLTCSAPVLVNGAVVVEVALSEPSATFAADDISTSNAGVDVFSGSGGGYSFMLAPVADGAFSCFVGAGTFTDSAGNPNPDPSNTIERTYDGTPPEVDSVELAGGEHTNDAEVEFTVTFSEEVTGVDETDLAVATGAKVITGASVTGVSGTGDTYTVTVDTGTGDGSLGLDVVDDDSIEDDAGNPLGGAGAGNGDFTGGASYNVDKTPPIIQIGPPTPESTVEGPVSFGVTYAEADAVTLAVDDVTLNTGDGITGTISVTGTGNEARTVTVSDIVGLGSFTISVAAGTATDLAGNEAPAAGPSDPCVVRPGIPLAWWPVGVVLLVVGAVLVCGRRRRAN